MRYMEYAVGTFSMTLLIGSIIYCPVSLLITFIGSGYRDAFASPTACYSYIILLVLMSTGLSVGWSLKERAKDVIVPGSKERPKTMPGALIFISSLLIGVLIYAAISVIVLK